MPKRLRVFTATVNSRAQSGQIGSVAVQLVTNRTRHGSQTHPTLPRQAHTLVQSRPSSAKQILQEGVGEGEEAVESLVAGGKWRGDMDTEADIALHACYGAGRE